jgi:uncharacterized membrane protein YphA (DoxX/SURF4 family)
MSKRNKIIYWIATVWLSLGMLSSGIIQLLQTEAEVEFMAKLGYPEYFLIILGVWKVLGVIAILIPKYPLLKEWAYAGFFFTMTGAMFSHVASGDPLTAAIPALLLTVLTVVSWHFRPAGRKVASVSTIS